MKFTIINNQPVKRMLPIVGSLTIEPYGILVINKSEKFRKSFENLSAYGYSVYCEEDIPVLKNTGTIKSDFMKSNIPNNNSNKNSSKDKLEIKDEESSPLGDKLKSIMGSKPKETEKEKPAIKDKSKESESKEEEKIDKDELEIKIDNSDKLEKKDENKAEEKKETKETKESILNKCKSLSADTLRAILREIGITSTSNNTNTLFNKLSNSETNDELLTSAYHKVVDKDV